MIKEYNDLFYLYQKDFYSPSQWFYAHDVLLVCVDETKIIIKLPAWFTEEEIKAILK